MQLSPNKKQFKLLMVKMRRTYNSKAKLDKGGNHCPEMGIYTIII
jgi:hypothetical protein